MKFLKFPRKWWKAIFTASGADGTKRWGMFQFSGRATISARWGRALMAALWSLPLFFLVFHILHLRAIERQFLATVQIDLLNRQMTSVHRTAGLALRLNETPDAAQKGKIRAMLLIEAAKMVEIGVQMAASLSGGPGRPASANPPPAGTAVEPSHHHNQIRAYVAALEAFAVTGTAAESERNPRLSNLIALGHDSLLPALERAVASDRAAGEKGRKQRQWRERISVIALITLTLLVLALFTMASRRRRQVEKSLQESEETLRNIIAGVPAVPYRMVQTQDRLLFFSYLETEHLRGTPLEAIAKSRDYRDLVKLIHPEDLERYNDSLIECQKTLQPWQLEFRYVLPSGETRWAQGASKPTRQPNGDVHWDGLLQDITERKRVEQELRRSETRYRLLIEGSIQGILVQREQKALFVNAAFARIFGFDDPEEILRLDSLEQLVSPQERGRLTEFRKSRMAGQGAPSNYRGRGVRKDGTEIQLETIVTVIQWDDAPAVQVVVMDVTETHRAEEELQESRERLEHIISNIPGAPYRFVQHRNGNMKFTYFNPGNLRELGFDAEKILADANALVRMVLPEDREAYYLSLARSGTTLEPWKVEFRLVTPSGGERWIQGASHATRQPNGDVFWDGLFLDVTERKLAEEKLRASEEKYRNLIEGSVQGVVVHRKGKPLFANQAYAQFFSFDSAQELLEVDSLDDLIAPADRARLVGYHEARLKGDEAPSSFEFQGLRRDGSLIWLEAVVRKVIWEGEEASQLTAYDITQRKKAEEERALLAAAIEQADDAIFITDIDGRIQYVNPGFERATGFSREEALGSKPEILKSGRMEPGFFRNLWETVLAGKVFQSRYTNKRKDGTLYEVEATHSPVRNESANITHFISVQKEITQQVLLESQLRRSQQMESLGNLAGGIAHDFNNLLMPILGFTELILKRHGNGDEDSEDLHKVLKAGNRAKELVGQILLFSRKLETKRKSVQLQLVVAETVKLLRSTLPSTIAMEVSIGPDLKPVFADPTQMNQVLMNLCVNANHAMPEGGHLHVIVENFLAEETPVYMEQTISGPFVRIRVRDTGVGMSEELIAHIFEPFYTTKEVGKGTGLGLSMVFGIIAEHDGYLNVASVEGEGSTFEVYLPAWQGKVEEEVEAEVPSEVPTGDETILLVDDEEMVAQVAKRMLQSLGYHVVAKTDSGEALEYFRAKPGEIDLVITDQTMPGMTGSTLAQKLRTIRGDIPIVLCTGLSTQLSPEEARELGIAEYILKPFTSEKLGRIVRKVLESTKPPRPLEFSHQKGGGAGY